MEPATGEEKERGSWEWSWCLGLRCVQGGRSSTDLGDSASASPVSAQLLCRQVSSQNAAGLKTELRRGEELKEQQDTSKNFYFILDYDK